MCDHGIRNIEKQDFDETLLGNIGDFIASAQIVDLTGLGEPMLSTLFWSILDRFPAASGPPFLMFNTNGTLLNDRNIERILSSRVRRMRVSIDSACSEQFRAIRDTSLSDIVLNTRRLTERRNALGRPRPLIGIEMTLMRSNLDGVPGMVDLARDVGADFLEVWSLNELPVASTAQWQVERRGRTFRYADEVLSGLDQEELKVRLDGFIAYAKSRGVPMAYIALGTGVGTDDYPYDGHDLPSPVEWNDRSIRCEMPWREMRVTYDGDVFACCWGPKPIGNIRELTLEQVWESPALAAMRGDLVDGRVPVACAGAGCLHIQGRSH